jgi:hypothetical protein
MNRARSSYIYFKNQTFKDQQPIVYDKQQADKMLAQGFYCYKYRIKMSNRAACAIWANSHDNEIGPAHEDCLRCPNYEHMMNLKDFKDLLIKNNLKTPKMRLQNG